MVVMIRQPPDILSQGQGAGTDGEGHFPPWLRNSLQRLHPRCTRLTKGGDDFFPGCLGAGSLGGTFVLHSPWQRAPSHPAEVAPAALRSGTGPGKPDEAQLPPGFPPQPLRHAFQGAGVIAHLPESVQAFLHCFSVFPPCRREDWRTFSSAGSRISFPGRSFSRFSSPCSNSSIASAPSS